MKSTPTPNPLPPPPPFSRSLHKILLTYVGGLSVHKDVHHSAMVDATIKNRVLNLQRLLIIHAPAWERDEPQK